MKVFIAELIGTMTLVLFGCGAAVLAGGEVGQLGIAYVDHDVSRDVALRQRIADETGWRTVPMIYLDGRFVGGFDDLSALHRRGGLVR